MRLNKQLVIQVPLRPAEYYSIRESARTRRTTAAAIIRELAELPHPPLRGGARPGSGRRNPTARQ